jgi:hypothetical protein
MGGDYYDRNVVSTTNNKGYSDVSNQKVGKLNRLKPEMNPSNWKDTKLESNTLNPIVFALDVTGSMGDWTKIIYDKMPMFYGQIMFQNYLKEPSISFCAVGDYTSDEAPLQISKFGCGSQIDDLISNMYLEGGGGGTHYESYELAAYFFNNFYEMKNSELPFFFITGDESYYEKIQEKYITKVIGKPINENFVISKEIWKQLMLKFNVFLIKKPYDEERREITILKQWRETLGEERVLMINNPKACIDVMLGAIALTSGHRTLETYRQDMINRDQTKERIEEVCNALTLYSKKIQEGNKGYIVSNQVKSNETNKKIEDIGIVLEDNIKNEIEQNLKLEEDEEKLKLREDLKHLKKVFGQVPDELICPITGEIFVDPVMTCDGHTYERLAIEAWLIKKKTSPITNLVLENKNLFPNFVIKQLVQAFYDENLNKI